jgi:hypothetical protein
MGLFMARLSTCWFHYTCSWVECFTLFICNVRKVMRKKVQMKWKKLFFLSTGHCPSVEMFETKFVQLLI